MSRCDCEGVFYRVFCVSLLVIAFTFTVILTNVFVDIDNLLSKRERESTENKEAIEHVTNNNDHEDTTEIQDYYIGAEKNDEGSYRSKRSVEPDNFFFRINSPRTKSYLTNKLATLLESLDDEESDNTTPKTENGNIYIKTVKQKNNIEINELRPENKKHTVMHPDVDMMYMALFKMLQGIGQGGKYELIDNLRKMIRRSRHGGRRQDLKNAEIFGEQDTETTPKEGKKINEEENVMETQFKDKEIKEDEKAHMSNIFDLNEATEADNDKGFKEKEGLVKKNKNPTYIIKTLVDIQSDGKTNSKEEDFQGVIKLIYNGKPVKIIREDRPEIIRNEVSEIPTTTVKTTTIEDTTTTTESTVNSDVEAFADVLKDKFKNRQIPDSYLRTITLEYLKKFQKTNDSLTKIKKKKIRIKRNVETSDEKQLDTQHKNDDDELFVEIETHFDKSGMEGEKKRKLVSSLIEKIQKAIRSSPENTKQDRDQREPYVLKRIQNPLERGISKNHTKITPVSNVYRNVDPISKTLPIVDPFPIVTGQNGENWKRQNPEPKFLSSSKSINSAELNQLAVDYKENKQYPVIPKRVQLPLSVDTSQETTNTEDVGKLQLLVKDIEGTGFSIGYNQYVDQAPDAESIKLFHGIENIVKKYHQKHDNPDKFEDHDDEYEMYGQELRKREVQKYEAPIRTKRFVMNRPNIRQSAKKLNDNRQKENKYIYRANYRPYDLYKKLHDNPIRSIGFEENNRHSMIFEKDVESSFMDEHLRKKRTLKTIMKSDKMRVNKFLNTNTFPRQKRYFKINKRNKRQIEDINVLDKTGLASENSNMFVVSSDDVFNDKLLVRRRQKPDLFFVEVIKSNKEDPFFRNKPFFQPSNHPFGLRTSEIKDLNGFNPKPMFYKSESNALIKIQENKERNKRQLHTIRVIDRDMAYKNPNQGLNEYFEDVFADRAVITGKGGSQNSQSKRNYLPNPYRNPFFSESKERVSFEHKNSNRKTTSEHEFSDSPTWEQLIVTPLMAKYPHVFKEGVTRLESPQMQRNMFSKVESKESNGSFDDEELYQSSNVKDLLNAVVPTRRNNFRVNIRLIPHDSDNDTKQGFKEIHTSINKTFHKNGLQYISLVNMTEISKVEVPKNTNTNVPNKRTRSSTSTTSNDIITNTKKSLRMEKDINNNYPFNNKETNNGLNISKNIPIEVSTNANMDMNLMEIILPSSPRKVFHLTMTDLGKLICDAIKPKNSDTLPATQTDKVPIPTILTISSTTTTTTVPIETTTIKPITTTQTVDPLKIKMLKAISQNEQLTSQILNRIDQNTDILQSFLSKITKEIAKLPDIANQAIIERVKMNVPEHNITSNSNVYTNLATNLIPVTNAYLQEPAAKRRSNFVQTSPILRNVMINDRIEDTPIINYDAKESLHNEQAKYFMDTVFLNKTTLRHDLDKANPNNPIAYGLEDKTRNKYPVNKLTKNPKKKAQSREPKQNVTKIKNDGITTDFTTQILPLANPFARTNSARTKRRNAVKELKRDRNEKVVFEKTENNDKAYTENKTRIVDAKLHVLITLQNDKKAVRLRRTKREDENDRDKRVQQINDLIKNWRAFVAGWKRFWSVDFKAMVFGIRRELRNLEPIKKMYPTKDFLVDYYHDKFTVDPQPETFAAVTKAVVLMVRHVFGVIPEDYSRFEYYHYLKPTRIV